MIRFIIKNNEGAVRYIKTYKGDASVSSKREYMHTRQHPFIADKEYRYFPYWSETIGVRALTTSDECERLRQVLAEVIDDDLVYLQCRIGNRIYTRKLDVRSLPDPTYFRDITQMQFNIKFDVPAAPFDISSLIRVNTQQRYNTVTINTGE